MTTVHLLLFQPQVGVHWPQGLHSYNGQSLCGQWTSLCGWDKDSYPCSLGNKNTLFEACDWLKGAGHATSDDRPQGSCGVDDIPEVWRGEAESHSREYHLQHSFWGVNVPCTTGGLPLTNYGSRKAWLSSQTKSHFLTVCKLACCYILMQISLGAPSSQCSQLTYCTSFTHKNGYLV